MTLSLKLGELFSTTIRSLLSCCVQQWVRAVLFQDTHNVGLGSCRSVRPAPDPAAVPLAVRVRAFLDVPLRIARDPVPQHRMTMTVRLCIGRRPGAVLLRRQSRCCLRPALTRGRGMKRVGPRGTSRKTTTILRRSDTCRHPSDAGAEQKVLRLGADDLEHAVVVAQSDGAAVSVRVIAVADSVADRVEEVTERALGVPVHLPAPIGPGTVRLSPTSERRLRRFRDVLGRPAGEPGGP